MALSIPHVGTVTAQDLAREFKTLSKLKVASQERLEAVQGIGSIVAKAVADFFRDPTTAALLAKYQEAGIKIQSEKTGGALDGKTFVFTGSLGDMSREEAKQLVIARGGKVASTVGKSVDYVVIGEDAGSKAAKAQKLGLTILTPTEFQNLTQL